MRRRGKILRSLQYKNTHNKDEGREDKTKKQEEGEEEDEQQDEGKGRSGGGGRSKRNIRTQEEKVTEGLLASNESMRFGGSVQRPFPPALDKVRRVVRSSATLLSGKAPPRWRENFIHCEKTV